MLFILIPSVWLIVAVVFTTVCRMAALGDATRALATEWDAQAAAAIDGLLAREEPIHVGALQEQGKPAARRQRITA
jgi:hypothetical protein